MKYVNYELWDILKDDLVSKLYHSIEATCIGVYIIFREIITKHVKIILLPASSTFVND